MSELRSILTLAPVIPVLVVEQIEQARKLGQALVDGGLPVLEVTLRSDAALAAIEEMASIPGAVVGAGTVLSAQDVSQAKRAGARFAVSPGATDSLLDAVEEAELPLLPGAATASEVMFLLERGFEIQKFFPAEAAGGVSMLKSFSGPLPQVSFCPTGGVNPHNVADYLALSNVICVGGTWVADPQSVQAQDWAGIESSARAAAALPVFDV